MKTKTINSILCKKFDAFLESITDEATKKLVEEGTIITGGSIVSMLLREKVNDYDLYFKDRQTAWAVANYYVREFKKNPPPTFKDRPNHAIEIGAIICVADNSLFKGTIEDAPTGCRIKIVVKSAGIAGEQSQDSYQYFEGISNTDEQADAATEYVEGATQNIEELDRHAVEELVEIAAPKKSKKADYHPVFLTSNAITLSDRVQLIIRFYGMPDDIHSNYDFVHCTSYWTSWDRKVVLRPDAMEAMLNKELKYVGSKYPICSIIRTRKFLARGWTINAGQYVKMCWQVSKLNLEDVAVLEDQLIGVDSAYFLQLITLLRENINKNPEQPKIDGTYLMTVIDKIF